jgi:uncharacterized membrane protein YeaQ/YmgE (transglycosylase-associated protein family)
VEAIAEAAFQYLKENLVVTLAIALIAGFAGVKTVAIAKKGNIVLYLFVGLLGAFLGQFVILYLDLKGILDQLSEFRYFFDLLAAYIASFVVASLIHFVKPL